MHEKTSRFDKGVSATDMVRSEYLERKEAEAQADKERQQQKLSNELLDLEAFGETISDIIAAIRMQEVNGAESYLRSDLIECLRESEGTLQRMIIDFKKRLRVGHE